MVPWARGAGSTRLGNVGAQVKVKSIFQVDWDQKIARNPLRLSETSKHVQSSWREITSWGSCSGRAFCSGILPKQVALWSAGKRERESLRLFVQNCRLIETIFVIGTGKEKQGRHPSTETKITVLTSLKKNLCKFYSLFF